MGSGYPERDPDLDRSRDSKVRDPDRNLSGKGPDEVSIPQSRRFKSSEIPIPKFVSGSGFDLPYYIDIGGCK